MTYFFDDENEAGAGGHGLHGLDLFISRLSRDGNLANAHFSNLQDIS